MMEYISCVFDLLLGADLKTPTDMTIKDYPYLF